MQTELEILRAENLALQQKLSRKDEVLARKDELIAQLEEEIRLHILRRFGPRAEVYKNPLQPSLFNETETECPSETNPIDGDEEVNVGSHSKKRGKRTPLPSFLPRVKIEHDLSADEKICPVHGQEMVKMGEDISEQLEIIPEQIKVLEHVRPKYKCPCCEGLIKQQPMPPQPIAGSMASAGLLAFIAVSKYLDHMPLYRLENRFSRINVDLSRATMARWMIRLGELLTPVYNLLQDELLDSPIVQMDETTVLVLKEEGRSPSSKSYMWVRARC